MQYPRKTIAGITVTPFDPATKTIDWQAAEDNVKFLANHGLKVLVPCGHTSEFYALSIEEAKETVRRTVKWAEGNGIYIAAGIGYAVPTAVELGLSAKKAGAHAVMIHQPVHPYVTEAGILSYYTSIIQALDMPVIIYFKDENISDRVLKKLAPMEQLVGVKYAINDLPRFAAVVRDIPQEHGIAWICGTAEKWAPFFHHAGAEGFTSGLVNVCPDMSFDLLNALNAGDHEEIWNIWSKVVPFENLRAKYRAGNNVAVVKEAMNQLGLSGGATREPVDPLDEADRQAVSDILKSWGKCNGPGG